MNRLTKGKALVGAINATTLSVGGTDVTATAAELNILDNQCASATFTVGAESGGNTINVAIQLKDAAGTDMAIRTTLLWYLSSDANGDAIAVATSSGIAIGTDGLLIESVNNLSGMVTSEADGDIDVNLVEASTGTWYLVLVLPTGKLAVSGAITFA
jgi:hypothetical protein